MSKTKQPTEAQRFALKRAIQRAYTSGWDGKARSTDATGRAPALRAGRRRYITSSAVGAPLPTCEALERQGLVKDYNAQHYLFALTKAGIEIGEAECKADGVDPKAEAAKRRDEEAAERLEKERELLEVCALFSDISIKPTAKGSKKTTLDKVIKERATGSGNCCFDLDELVQIGKQL